MFKLLKNYFGVLAGTNTNYLYQTIIILTILLYLFLGALSFARTNWLAITLENFSIQQLINLMFILLGLLLGWLILLIIKPKPNNTIKYALIIIFFLGLITPPLLSVDTTGYALNAEVLYSQNKNPYLTTFRSASVPKELTNIWWMDKPSPYGPSFLLIIFLPWLISFSNLFIFIYAYKLLVLMAFLLSYWLFSRLRQKAGAPTYVDVLFLLNPALLINLLIEGHNEVFITLFLLSFLYFKDHLINGLGYIAMAVFIKFSTLLVWPLTWFKNKKFNWQSFVTSSLALASISLLFFRIINLWPQDFLKQNILFINNDCFYRCPLVYEMLNFLPANLSFYIKISAFFLSYLAILYCFLFRKYEPTKFIVWSLMALFFIITKWLTPWYPALIIPFSLLINNKKYLLLSSLLTIYSLLHYMFLI